MEPRRCNHHIDLNGYHKGTSDPKTATYTYLTVTHKQNTFMNTKNNNKPQPSQKKQDNRQLKERTNKGKVSGN